MITIWFEAHATSLDNEAKLASGWNDVDLSELGYQQADELVARNVIRNIDVIFCSDMQRSVKTALPLARQVALPIYVDERLRECNYGKFTQRPKDEVDVQKLIRLSDAFPGGESYQDCAQRMHKFLMYLRENFDNKTVLIIGHRATQYGIENFINKVPLDTCVTQKWQWQPGWKYQI